MATSCFVARFVTLADGGEWGELAASRGPVGVDRTADVVADLAGECNAASGRVGMLAHAGGGRGVGFGQVGGNMPAGSGVKFYARERDAVGCAAGAALHARRYVHRSEQLDFLALIGGGFLGHDERLFVFALGLDHRHDLWLIDRVATAKGVAAGRVNDDFA